MLSIAKSDPLLSIISLDRLDSWTVLDVLKQAEKAGYRRDPSRPILLYRRALWKKMKQSKGEDGERMSDTYLAAEKAFIASKYDQSLLSFAFSTMGSKMPMASAPLTLSSTSCSPLRKKLQPISPKPKNKSFSGYKPAPYVTPKKTIIKGFILKKITEKPVKALPLCEQPSGTDPEPNDTIAETGKRNRLREPETGHEKRPLKVAKRGGWLY